MLSYKKKTHTESENVLRDQKRDNRSFNISDITKIENTVEKPDQIPQNGGAEPGLNLTNVSGVTRSPITKQDSEHVLNLGMNANKNAITSRGLDVTANDVDPGTLEGGNQAPKLRTDNTLGTNGLNNVGGFLNQRSGLAQGTAQSTVQGAVQGTVPSQNYVINIQQTVDRESIIVETLHAQKKFVFYDRNKNFLGGFSVYDFVKYVTSNVSVNFLAGVDGDSVKPIIEKYICNVKKVETPSKRYIINMLSYLESPFMGNIETLIKFYTFVHEFETSMLEDELTKIPKQESVAVVDIFNNMLYTLLNHILKIIAILTNKLEWSDPNSAKIRSTLLNYSVAIVYRLSKFVRDDTTKKMDELNVLNQDLLRIEGIRTSVNTKIENVQKAIDKQSTEIDIVLRNLMMCQMVGDRTTQQTVRQTVGQTVGKMATPESRESIMAQLVLNDDGETVSGSPVTSQSSSEQVSSSTPVSSSLDKSNIYNVASESGRKTLHERREIEKKRSENLRVSELLDDLSRLRSVSDAQAVTQQSSKTKVQENMQSDPQIKMFSVGGGKNESDKTDKSNKTRDTSKVSEVSERDKSKNKHVGGSSKGKTNVPKLDMLPTDSVQSLSDIINMHNKVNFSSESDLSQNSFESGDDRSTDRRAKLKHSSKDSIRESSSRDSTRESTRESTGSSSKKTSKRSLHDF
ncbi:hypothetical protein YASMINEVIRUS_835 [Yasminevirus sp. GU-2018]|uniref:Uncharacterized protein n=1 Tax=Yasminevirus sp. GU-2018 TaxID=2420051 RepID=A0A5K0UA51_9VIRU|nr:hypothetical protein YASMINEVIRUS_835 [Yasminevirus sp. GU-2018]